MSLLLAYIILVKYLGGARRLLCGNSGTALDGYVVR